MKFIDLFCGIGGMRLGFQDFGECVFSSEIDKFARQTYLANFGEEPSGDITKIDSKDIPDHDVLLAGFPCQPFSQAGERKAQEDDRGNLFLEIVRVLKDKQPKAFLLENVPGLLTIQGGRVFELIKKHICNAGYNCIYKNLSSKDFGVPQNRNRLYMVGIRRDLDPYFYFPDKIELIKSLSIGNVLDKNVDRKYTISDKLWKGHKRRKKQHLEKGNGFGYSLFNSNSKHTNTLTARYYKDGSEILIEQESNNPRKLTTRECARLQGFPDSFNIPVSDTQAYKQFGNAVTVSVIKEIAKKLHKII